MRRIFVEIQAYQVHQIQEGEHFEFVRKAVQFALAQSRTDGVACRGFANARIINRNRAPQVRERPLLEVSKRMLLEDL